MKSFSKLKIYHVNWMQKQLQDISNKVNDKNINKKYSKTLTNSATKGIISQKDYFDKQISNPKNIDKYYIVENNDFVYNPRISSQAPYGPINRNKLEITGIMSPLYYVFRPKNINNNFLEYYFKSFYWHKFMYQNGDTGARSDRFAISNKLFKTMPINLPDISEQNKIGLILKSIDNIITLEQEKINTYNKMKIAFLEKLYTKTEKNRAQLHFSNFNSDWTQEKLDNLVTVHSGKSYKHLEQGNVPVYGTGGYMTSVNENLSEKDAVGLGRKGTINKPQLLNAPFWTVDTLFYIITNNNVDLTFFYYLTQTINWLKYDESTGVPSLSKKTIQGIKVMLPSLDEQVLIGKYLKKIDEVTTLQQTQLNNYKEIKMILLQNLFV